MTPGHACRWLVLAVSALLAACGTTFPVPLAPAMFPALQAPATKDPSAVVLSLENQDQVFTSAPLRHYQVRIQMPIGRIVEAAGLLALGQEFAAVAAAADKVETRALRLQVSGVALDLKSEFVYFIPLPPIWPTRVDVTVRLVFTLQVLGPDGALRWSQDYDSGPELWLPKKPSFLVVEPVQTGVQRLAHELSLRLMRQAAQDLRAWLEQERLRERVL